MADALPIISLLNSVMTIQSYIRSATTVSLPPVITGNNQYGPLLTQFQNWQEELWTAFWEGLLSDNIVAEAAEVRTYGAENITEQQVFSSIFYDGTAVITEAQCDTVATLITQGQVYLTALEQIAEQIENADKAAVKALTKLSDTLQKQFSQQEDELTKETFNTMTEVVGTAVDVALAVGTDGEDVEPLVKGVIKIGESTIKELTLTADIQQTLNSLEAAWAALDQDTANLAQITHVCRQLKSVSDSASQTLTALSNLSNDWNTIATTTQVDSATWTSTSLPALQQWATQMGKVSFGNVTQSITVSATAPA